MNAAHDLHAMGMGLASVIGLAVAQGLQNARHQAAVARARATVAAYDSALSAEQTISTLLLNKVVELSDDAEDARDEADTLRADLARANDLISRLTTALKRRQAADA
jgi:hypothetical protein